MKFYFSVFFTFLLLQSSLFSLAQSTMYCVDLKEPAFEQYDLFNQDIEDKKIILLGEHHYLTANAILQAELLMHLNKTSGVRHLLIELGQAEAYLYNQYLQTGDERYLDYSFWGFTGYEEFYASTKKLYDYNAGLADDKKLVVHGLDFERDPSVSASLHQLLSDYPANLQIDSVRNFIQARLDTVGVERDIKEYILHLKDRISALSLPEDENKKIIDDILNNPAFFTNLETRDSLMAETFYTLDTAGEIYLGQFGAGHTMLNNRGGLANRLNGHEKYRGKILVTNMYPIYSGNAQDHPFENLSDCPVFLYRFDSSNDGPHAGANRRGQWALVLKEPKRYNQSE